MAARVGLAVTGLFDIGVWVGAVFLGLRTALIAVLIS